MPKIIVNLSEEDYNKAKDGRISVSTMRKALLDGTVLSEPHGRLIDADALLKHKTDHEYISTHLIYNAPTILEGMVME